MVTKSLNELKELIFYYIFLKCNLSLEQLRELNIILNNCIVGVSQ